jgi:hypothetical protein
MSKLRSVFSDMESVEAISIATGEPCHDAPPMRMQVECVYKGRRIVAIYIVADGERIAYRGRKGDYPYDYRAWIPMRDDVLFHNGNAPGNSPGRVS